jgi:hypothetical protein
MRPSHRGIVLSLAVLAVPFVSYAQNKKEINNAATENSAQTAVTSGQQAGQLTVICKGDQLTITANGSPLSLILSEVARCSGAKIEDSEATVKTKLFETIGPAPVRDVLSSLLDASGINYVIQLSDSNPKKIEAVLLLARADHNSGGESADDPSLSPGRRAYLKQIRQNAREEEGTGKEDDSAGSSSPASPPPSSINPDPPPPQVTTPAVEHGTAPTVEPTPSSSQTNLQDKIAEMQRMFEQRKQMVQEQNSRPH